MAKDWAADEAARIGDEIRRLRGSRSAQWLSDQTDALGYRVAHTTISELESHQRAHVSTAELAVLAKALDIAPIALLYPPSYSTELEVLPGVDATSWSAAEWFSGRTDHRQRVVENVRALAEDRELAHLTSEWIRRSLTNRYSYNFEWLGRPIIQYPQDIVCLQELIWAVKPDVIVETGIAHGGSLILSASMLALIDLCEAITNDTPFDPRTSNRKVIGVDIEIRAHNRAAIENHPLSGYITMIEGSSVDPATIRQVHDLAAGRGATLVCLDSNHTHEHVLGELSAYASLVTPESYCVVFDTVVEDMPDMFPDRPWGQDNNPKTAVWEFLKSHSEFEIDHQIPQKLQITVAPDGYLRRVR
ncbi:CmcI family methyltransferase [Mycolicibacterium pulveris]|uniref:CmcI family methyltransferase n=1 Tax=Mycolicibacterium pulveris TaxID=36813 RepID=UPI003CE8F3F0